jgi:hypothetical protein
MIADPTRKMRRVAAHSDFTIDDGHRRRCGIGFPPDPVRNSEHRHDRPFGEGDLLRQRLEPGGNPPPLGCEKLQTLAHRHAAG